MRVTVTGTLLQLRRLSLTAIKYGPTLKVDVLVVVGTVVTTVVDTVVWLVVT